MDSRHLYYVFILTARVASSPRLAASTWTTKCIDHIRLARRRVLEDLYAVALYFVESKVKSPSPIEELKRRAEEVYGYE